MTPEQINALPDLSDAQLLKLVRHQIATVVAGGKAYGINGRSLTRSDLSELREQQRDLEARIAGADGTGGVALVTFNNPR